MADRKSIVFISHIDQEKEVALKLKELVSRNFLGLIQVFISSDGESISMGRRWLEQITESLKERAVEIVICSPESVTRPWINFEAGAGWVRDIPVIPFCHSGMKRNELPVPLNMLQAANADDVLDLERVFTVLAKALDADTPDTDFGEFLEAMRAFEEQYTFWDQCNAAFLRLNELNPEFVPALKSAHEQGVDVEIDLSDSQHEVLRSHLEFLKENSILHARQNGSVKIGNQGGPGVLTGWSFQPLDRLESIYEDANFAFGSP